MEVIYMLLIFIFLFCCISLGFIYLTVNRMKSFIETRHRAAEIIVNSHRAPESWTYSTVKRLRKAPNQVRSASIKRRGKESCLRRLSQLIEYFKHAPFFDSDDSRGALIEELSGIYRLWEHKEWDEIVMT